MPDKFSATWLSHSSISDFQKCPQLYFYNNVYRNPQTGNKIQLISPQLSLGQAVHEVLESLSVLPTESRFDISLIERYQTAWEKVSGEKGGFSDQESESRFKERGAEMLRRIMKNPGPLKNKAVKIRAELPYFWLSEEEELILCGKIDWLEYFPESDSVGVLDFKTGKSRERDDSLQLPIYVLLATHCQKRDVIKISYWYLADKTYPQEQTMPKIDATKDTLMEIGRKIKLARKFEKFACASGEKECRFCGDIRRVAKGEGKLVGTSQYGQDMFVLPAEEDAEESVIL